MRINILVLFLWATCVLSCSTGKVKAVDPDKAASAQNGTSQFTNGDDSRTATEVSHQLKQPAAGPVNVAMVKSHLDFLASDALAGRETGTNGIEQAASYAAQIFEKAGAEAFYPNYRDAFAVNGLTANNVVAKVKGTDPQLREEYIILGAHYDHIGTARAVNGDTIANGANDNASGSTAVLELAKYFAANPTKRSMLFVLFSAEEKGLLGSKHLAKQLANENIDVYTMFNIEMVGVPMATKDYLLYLTGYEMSNMAQVFNDYSGEKIVGFLPKAKQYNLFKRSDNYPFYQQMKIPAQTVSSFDFTNYDYYHHVDDEVGFIDVQHVTQVINRLIPGLKKMANDTQKTISLNE